MATVIEPRREDDTEQALIQLDRDFATIYGPNMSAWSKGVRGELLETQRARRTADREAHPLHPRKASAGRRRRHLKQLPYRVHAVAPGAVTVLITSFWSDATGHTHRVLLAQCLDADGQRIRLPRGGSQRLAALLQGAFPGADWDRPQSWRADTNQLVDRRTLADAELRARTQRLAVRAAGLEAQLAFERERNFELRTAANYRATAAAGYIDRTGLEGP